MQTAKVRVPDSIEYKQLEQLVSDRIRLNQGRLFQTDASDLYAAYLSELPLHERQHYNCRTCRKFFDDYGGLVTITAEGEKNTLIFEPDCVPSYFKKAFAIVRKIVQRAKIVCPFVNYDKVWGKPVTGEWTHLACKNARCDPKVIGKEAHEVMAEYKEDYAMLQRAMTYYSPKIANQALALLQSDTMYRSEKAIEQAKWFVQAHQNRKNVPLLWYIVATAPKGFCHINSTMIATLMDDLLAEMNTSVIMKRWAEKMHPLQYQRPTKEVSKQTVKRAEEIVAEMGVARSLERRFAEFPDVRKMIWMGPVVKVSDGAGNSVFGHLLPKEKSNLLELPAQTMTWVKFANNILPTAIKITYVPNMMTPNSYYGLVAPVYDDAPPIIKWDNQVTWYVYTGDKLPKQFNILGPTPVSCIFGCPAHWSDPSAFKNETERVFFALTGSYDVEYKNGGMFFPEQLRGEFHGVRAVMEKFATTGTIQGRGEVNGIVKSNGNMSWNIKLNVETAEAKATYLIDRFD